ncbi:hypothetical protein K8O68_13000 [Salipaludibacillus sp. CUR1]|uniref:hypothetical protein n=1 Tax=Salipaludibacillus sp. CUR1 TaxID=2820003 RepID=UPI001E2DE1BB|nr:hypothetical protein [Salipaludibacillus sp. CUR1]MCE7793338.1 hypothetical protein [Salipaludibacillus sp. CUR1]
MMKKKLRTLVIDLLTGLLKPETMQMKTDVQINGNYTNKLKTGRTKSVLPDV